MKEFIEQEPRLLEIGERYMVKWRNGQVYPGDIIEIRQAKKKEDIHAVSSNENQNYEYYIHFPQFDRRLDEWVTADRIDQSTIIVPSVNEKDTEHNNSSKIRKNKRKLEDGYLDGKKDDKEAMLVALEKEHEEITKVKNIQSIILGKYEIETWYFSPYPDEYAGEEKMYICESCLKYMRKHKTLLNHSLKCTLRTPPGTQIYRENELAMFEVDGKDHKIYCQNLCLLSKLFLDHKTLYYDVDPFLFYILCEVDSNDVYHIVGYFSKEKQSIENYNLACILTFPPYQRKGYGKFLMSVSYELTKRENTTGSPEKPLSDLGKISYRSYWAYVILNLFLHRESLVTLTIQEMSKVTGIKTEDLLSTLHSLNMIKYWKGQHVISVNQKAIENHLKNAKKIRLCNPKFLTWQPPEKVSKKTG